MVQRKKAPVVIRSMDLAFPNDANPQGTMFGGAIMAIMDRIGGIAAGKFAGKPVVTVSTDAMHFINPVRIGDWIETIARIVWVGKTSLIVHVDVWAENLTRNSRQHCTAAFFTFVALDKKGKPTGVPSLRIKTDQEIQFWNIAEVVKRKALERKERIAGFPELPEGNNR